MNVQKILYQQIANTGAICISSQQVMYVIAGSGTAYSWISFNINNKNNSSGRVNHGR